MNKDDKTNKMELILAVMTPTQRRRWGLLLSGKNVTEIAKTENVDISSISESLAAGKKRAKKVLKF